MALAKTVREYPATERCVNGVTHFSDAPQWIYELDNPYLHGVYAPTLNELDVEGLAVEGEVPADLVGAYFRNGPNPVYQPKNRYHPFDGDGMVHGVYFRDGKAGYRNRYIQTLATSQERADGKSVSPGVMGPFDYALSSFGIKDTSNTDVFWYNGDLMTLWYNAGHPYRLDSRTLETRGYYDLQGRQQRRMSAHSKVDWSTGELLFFDYGDEPPFMTYGVADPQGRLLHEVAIDLPGPRLPHDIGFTTNYAILHDLPFFHDMDVLRQHKFRVLTFHRDIPTRFGIIPRRGQGSEVRWFECQPCYILHVTNCWEEDDWVVMDGCRSLNPMPDTQPGEGELASMLAYMRLEANAYRWRFNLKTGEVREGDIDDLNTEFNKSNPLFHGVKSKYSYHQRIPLLHEGGHTLRFTGLVKYNNDTGVHSQWDYGAGVFGSEAVYAPKPGAGRHSGEDDGYVITLATDSNNWKSECLVFDATDIAAGPVCRVQMPHRVPYGFHATWARGEDLYGGR
ncbi:MAG: carotenoid oxygenase family protein [Pseudomonadales bacterium]|nr:carotenoid oxygenase family protein [Halioglobus sp.]MCP5121445.1 carotenoid oxygenase family protein [Pseudomonadales bacterium]MCP5193214.1 carotenoid oxygenase family protein [Pseudomonadales bacterium]